MSARTRPPVLRCFRSASTRGVARYFCTWSCRQLGTTFGRSSGVTPTCFGCFLSGRCDWCFPGLRGPDFAPRFPPPCTCHSADGRHVLRLRGRLPYTETCESLARSPRRHCRTSRREGPGSLAGRAGSTEALAIDAYRMNRMTAYQLCQLLEIPSRYELDGFLKHHGVPLEYERSRCGDRRG